AAIIVVLAAIVALVAKRKREIIDLRDRFVPEYLAHRAERRDQLDIRELSSGARQRYHDAWINVQTRFVDEPNAAVVDADGLIAQVMRERGYPVDHCDEQADMISVDHPQVVENYRAGHAIFERAKHGQASTEDLRRAFVHYRSLFEELLETSRR